MSHTMAMKFALTFIPTFFLLLLSLSVAFAQSEEINLDILEKKAEEAMAERVEGIEFELFSDGEDVMDLYQADEEDNAIEVAKKDLEAVEKDVGSDHPDTALSMETLALLYHQQGMYAEAEPLYKKALEIREAALGRNHPDVALSLDDLALLNHNKGRYEEAEPLYNRALEIRKKALGPDHLEVASSLDHLASLHETQIQYDQAEPLYRQAQEIREKALGPNHPDVARGTRDLTSFYKRALIIREKQLGGNHPVVASTLNSLGELHQAQEQYEQAEPLYRRALRIRENMSGQGDATEIKAMAEDYDFIGATRDEPAFYQMSNSAGEKSDYWYASPDFHLRALEIREKLRRSNHPDIAVTLVNMAGLYMVQGQYEEAKPLYKRALGIIRRLQGRDHLDAATIQNSLAELYRAQGSYKTASKYYKRALAIREKQLGPDHPEVIAIRKDMASLKK